MAIPPEWIQARCQPAMCLVLERLRAILISVPKVAATSLKQVCADLLGLEGNVHLDVRFPTVPKHEIRLKHQDYFVFTFVRNPWDRLLSCYLSKMDPSLANSECYRDGVEFNFWKYGDTFRGDMSFREFVEAVVAIPDPEADIHFASQHIHLTDHLGHLLVDFLGRFERLHNDFAEACHRLRVPVPVLPHHNQTTHGHYSDYYDIDMCESVAKRYQRDIELFGYQVGESRQSGAADDDTPRGGR